MKYFILTIFIITMKTHAQIPEIKLHKIENALTNLNQQLSSSLGNHEKTIPSKFALSESFFWLEKKSWHTVIALLEPQTFNDPKQQLKRLYALGKSYEDINNHKSSQFYQQYLNLSQHQPSYPPQFMEVIQSLLLVSPKNLQGQQISSILTLNLNKETRHKVLLFIATFALKQNKTAMARKWLETIIKNEPTPLILSKTLYFLGTVATRERRYIDAESFFDSALGTKTPDSTLWKNKSKLALGHISRDKKKYKKALNFYKSVSSTSELYPKAIENSAHMLIRLKQYHSAIPLLEKRLTYPGNYLFFQKLLAWLDVQVGEKEKSKKSIASIQKKLNKDRNFILHEISSSKKISSLRFHQLARVIEEWIPHHHNLHKVKKVFHKISQNEKKLYGLQSRMKNIDYLMIYLGPERLLQYLKNDYFQIKNITDHAINQGHDLIQATTQQLNSQIPSYLAEHLKNSQKERIKRKSETFNIQKKYKVWRFIQESLNHLKNESTLKQRLENIEAKLQGISFRSKKQPTLQNYDYSMDPYFNKSRKIRKEIQRVVRLTKDLQLSSWSQATLIDNLALESFKDFKGIEEDWQKLSKIMKKDRTPIGTSRYAKNINLHEQWSYLAGHLLEKITNLKKREEDSIHNFILKKSNIHKKIKFLREEKNKNQRLIEEESVKILTYLKPLFITKFNKIEADLIKWEGDMEHQRALQIAKKKQKMKNAIKLEEEILLPSQQEARGVPL
ncbi:MAG: tetratricopeptide repeat protein [Oligoflexales bacterium]